VVNLDTKGERQLKPESGTSQHLWPDKREAGLIVPACLRRSAVGFVVGALPGAGPPIASFLAYSVAKMSAPRDRAAVFGNGAIEGVAAAESANNAACSGSLVPMLSLGIPGSAGTAVLLGALLMFGLRPGPLLFTNHP